MPSLRKYKLSILIPSRNEIWLAKTVEDILEHTSEDTEILVGLDGAWADPPIPQHDRVNVIYVPESIGQRAMTNLLCKLSKAQYVAKADAHCSFDNDWDVKMFQAFEETGDNVTMVSTMRNLHAFDWVCPDGHRRYQSPSGPCKDCGKPVEKDVRWWPKRRPRSTSFKFDSRLEFGYFNEYKEKQAGDIVETMSLQGSLFMLTREKYWELNVCDESWGSWGGQGAEVAIKTWLSGGKVLVNKRTWYSHLFRTQGGDFSFPYANPLSLQQTVKENLRETFLKNTWEKQIYPLSWLVERFWPVPGWTEQELEAIRKVPLPSK